VKEMLQVSLRHLLLLFNFKGVDRMKGKWQASLLFQLILFLFTSKLDAQFYTLETKHLKLIYYGQTHDYLVSHVARCFENSLKFHQKLFDYNPAERVTVLLHDFSDFGNAGAGAIPRNHIIVSIAPYRYVFDTSPANERMNSSMNHELVHIIAIDKAAPTDKFFRSLFGGKVLPASDNPISMIYCYLTAPRRYSPRWYNEGIAVFMETWMAGGLGRALGSYDEMVFRTMVRDSSHFYDVVGLESEGTKVDFQVGVNSYLYGTRFMSYLAHQHGPESLVKWVSRTNDSKGLFAAQFKKVYGTPLDEAWSQWIKWERQFQRANLDSIRLNPVTPYRALAARPLGSVSRAFYNAANRKLYAAINYPGQVAHLASIDLATGAVEKLGDVKGAALYYVSSLAYDPAAGALFYTTDNNDWRDLKVIDVKTGESQTLIQDARIGDLAFNQADKSIWGVRHYNGVSTLVRIPPPYKEWNQIFSWPYGQDVFDIDVSPDGALLTSALIDISGRQKLIKMDIPKLMTGDHTYDVLFDFENSTPANFVFSSDGKQLYGSSYYSGVSNIFRYDLQAEKMEVLSNAETGFFRPLEVSSDSLIAFCYTGKGFAPVMMANRPVENVSAIKFLGQEIVEKYPVVKSWLAGSPAAVKLDSLTTYAGKYRALKNLMLVSAYPIVEGYKDFPAYGMYVNVANPVGLHNFVLRASYTPNEILSRDERLHVNFSYGYSNWKINAKYNAADFYDLFGPTKASRKGYSMGLQYKKILLFDHPKTMDYSITLAGYGGLERLPDFQNISASFDKLLAGNVRLNYQYLRQSLGAVDDEKGFQWQLILNGNYVNTKIFPRFHTNFDYGLALPLNHSSVWLRSSLGRAFGKRDEPFANFYFGGFGNNWIDYLTEKRYRDYDSFPGVELNAVGGTNYGKALLEWTLPPLRFRRLGLPTFYCNWARLALFSSGLVTNLDSKANQRKLANIGGQLDFRLVILSHLNTTLSFGYGVAAEKDQRPAKELMVSLKIL